MSLYNQYKLSNERITKGIQVTFEPNDDGTVPTFIVGYMSTSNQRYNKSLERESKPYQRLIDLRKLPVEKDNEIMRRVFCSTILLGWENVQDANGKAIPFSFETAMQILADLPELFTQLKIEASTMVRFLESENEIDAKN